MTSYGKDFICDHVRFVDLSASSANVSGKATAGEVVATKFCMGDVTTAVASQTAITDLADPATTGGVGWATTGAATTAIDKINKIIKALEDVGILKA